MGGLLSWRRAAAAGCAAYGLSGWAVMPPPVELDGDASLTERLEAVGQMVNRVVLDLTKPEFWVGKEAADLWVQLALSIDSALLHFEDVSMPALYKLIPLVRAQLQHFEMHRYQPDVSWKEWELANASTVDRDRVLEFRELAPFAALAYDTPAEIRDKISELGFELGQWEPESSSTRPCYYVAFSPQRKRVIVAIRGTSSVTDMLTNLLHTPRPFLNDSFVHQGIADAGRFIVNRTETMLRHLFVPLGYEVVLTGHSLGAGVATVATLILRSLGLDGVRCVAFAPPPTLDRASAHLANDFVWNMVHHDDIIPRWNFGILASTFVVFNHFLREVDENGITPEEFYNKSDYFERTQQIRDIIEAKSAATGLQRDMHIAGRIVYFANTTEGYYWREVSPDFTALRRFPLSMQMISDHGLDAHVRCLDLALLRLKLRPDGQPLEIPTEPAPPPLSSLLLPGAAHPFETICRLSPVA